MDMVKTANTGGLLSSISKNWWGSQSAPAQVEHTNRSYEKLALANFNDYSLVEKRLG